MSERTIRDTPEADSTAERVALWRALHLQVDPPPHVLEDEVGLKLLAPDESWRNRPDMNPQFTRFFRASIVARARFVEDLVVEEVNRGVRQYVILGAGLDSFAERRRDVASQLQVFEVDRPGPQTWKQQRLVELGFGVPDWLHLVSVDFEAGASWLAELRQAGFDHERPAVLTSTGVSLYITKPAIQSMLAQIAEFSAGSTFVMSFILPLEFSEPEERPGYEASQRGAEASGTPFISFFSPEEML